MPNLFQSEYYRALHQSILTNMLENKKDVPTKILAPIYAKEKNPKPKIILLLNHLISLLPETASIILATLKTTIENNQFGIENFTDKHYQYILTLLENAYNDITSNPSLNPAALQRYINSQSTVDYWDIADLLSEFNPSIQTQIRLAKSHIIKEIIRSDIQDKTQQIRLYNYHASSYKISSIECAADGIGSNTLYNEMNEALSYSSIIEKIISHLESDATFIPEQQAYFLKVNGQNIKIVLDSGYTLAREGTSEHKKVFLRPAIAYLINQALANLPDVARVRPVTEEDEYVFVKEQAFLVRRNNIADANVELSLTYLSTRAIISLILANKNLPLAIFLRHLPRILTISSIEQLRNIFQSCLVDAKDIEFFNDWIVPQLAELIKTGYLMKKVLAALDTFTDVTYKLRQELLKAEKLIDIANNCYTKVYYSAVTDDGIVIDPASPTIEDIAEKISENTGNYGPGENLNSILFYLTPNEIEEVVKKLADNASNLLARMLATFPAMVALFSGLNDSQKDTLFPLIEPFIYAQCTSIEATNTFLRLLPNKAFKTAVNKLQEKINNEFLANVANYLMLTQGFNFEQRKYFFSKEKKLVFKLMLSIKEANDLLKELDIADGGWLINKLATDQDKLNTLVPNIAAIKQLFNELEKRKIEFYSDLLIHHIAYLCLNGQESIEEIVELLSLFSKNFISQLFAKCLEFENAIKEYFYSPTNFSKIMSILNDKLSEAFFMAAYSRRWNEESRRFIRVESLHQLRQVLEQSYLYHNIAGQYQDQLPTLLTDETNKISATKLADLLDLKSDKVEEIYEFIQGFLPTITSIDDVILILSRFEPKLRKKFYDSLQSQLSIIIPDEEELKLFTKAIEIITTGAGQYPSDVIDPVNNKQKFEEYINKNIAGKVSLDVLTLLLVVIDFKNYSAFVPVESVNLTDLHRANLALRLYPKTISKNEEEKDSISTLVKQFGVITSEQLVELSYGLTLNRFNALYDALIQQNKYKIESEADFIFVITHFSAARCQIMLKQLNAFSMNNISLWKTRFEKLNPQDFSFMLDLGDEHAVTKSADTIIMDVSELIFVLNMADRKQARAICRSLGNKLFELVPNYEELEKVKPTLDPIRASILEEELFHGFILAQQPGGIVKLLSQYAISPSEVFNRLNAHAHLFSNPKSFMVASVVNWDTIIEFVPLYSKTMFKKLLVDSRPIPAGVFAKLIKQVLKLSSEKSKHLIAILKSQITNHPAYDANNNMTEESLQHLAELFSFLTREEFLQLNPDLTQENNWLSRLIIQDRIQLPSLMILFDKLAEYPQHRQIIAACIYSSLRCYDLVDVMSIISALGENGNYKSEFIQGLKVKVESLLNINHSALAILKECLLANPNATDLQCDLFYSLVDQGLIIDLIKDMVSNARANKLSQENLEKLPVKGKIIRSIVDNIINAFERIAKDHTLPPRPEISARTGVKSETAKDLLLDFAHMIKTSGDQEKVKKVWYDACSMAKKSNTHTNTSSASNSRSSSPTRPSAALSSFGVFNNAPAVSQEISGDRVPVPGQRATETQ